MIVEKSACREAEDAKEAADLLHAISIQYLHRGADAEIVRFLQKSALAMRRMSFKIAPEPVRDRDDWIGLHKKLRYARDISGDLGQLARAYQKKDVGKKIIKFVGAIALESGKMLSQTEEYIRKIYGAAAKSKKKIPAFKRAAGKIVRNAAAVAGIMGEVAPRCDRDI